MIKNERLKRITSHLELLHTLELEGFKVKVSSHRDKRDSICEHWTIELERGKDVK